MKPDLTTTIAAGLMVGAVSLGASAASAQPLMDMSVAVPSQAAPHVDKVWYRCGYYRCYRPRYGGYYRPYRYGWYYRRPFVGVGIGGFGVRLF